MGFENCHPALNLIYFTAVLWGTLTFDHPVFLLISYICAFVYSVKRGGIKAFVFNIILIPLSAAFALYYSSYTHFGITVLDRNLIGNNMTLESLVYGLVLGVRASAVVMWFGCIFSVFTSDKVVYLFGRLSPRLSLFLSILLRMIPRIKTEAGRINTAQSCIGRGIGQGNIFGRIRNTLCIFSMLITRTIDSLSEVSRSMRSRGSTLRGRKAFSIYRFDNRDRAYTVFTFLVLTLTVMGAMLGQTGCIYDPRIILPPYTAVSNIFYTAYILLCIMPLCLELWTEYCFRRALKASFSLEKTEVIWYNFL